MARDTISHTPLISADSQRRFMGPFAIVAGLLGTGAKFGGEKIPWGVGERFKTANDLIEDFSGTYTLAASLAIYIIAPAVLGLIIGRIAGGTGRILSRGSGDQNV